MFALIFLSCIFVSFASEKKILIYHNITKKSKFLQEMEECYRRSNIHSNCSCFLLLVSFHPSFVTLNQCTWANWFISWRHLPLHLIFFSGSQVTHFVTFKTWTETLMCTCFLFLPTYSFELISKCSLLYLCHHPRRKGGRLYHYDNLIAICM